MAWLIREGIYYEELTTSPVPANDDTTEWVGIRVYQEENQEVVGHKDLYNLYMPPIHSSKDDDRQLQFDTTNLPIDPNTLYFGDINCHGAWDDHLSKPSGLSEK